MERFPVKVQLCYNDHSSSLALWAQADTLQRICMCPLVLAAEQFCSDVTAVNGHRTLLDSCVCVHACVRVCVLIDVFISDHDNLYSNLCSVRCIRLVARISLRHTLSDSEGSVT